MSHLPQRALEISPSRDALAVREVHEQAFGDEGAVVEAPYPILPEHGDAWQVRELRPGALHEGRGVVGCALALQRPEHWR